MKASIDELTEKLVRQIREERDKKIVEAPRRQARARRRPGRSSASGLLPAARAAARAARARRRPRRRADPRPAWQETGIHGIHRAREWDATVTAEAPGVEGNAVRWVALPDGTLLVEEGPDGRSTPLADAVEHELAPPYRARGARQVDDVWTVQATRIEVVALPDAPDGDSIDLARTTARRRSRSTAARSSARYPRSRSAASARARSTPSTRSGSTATSGRSARAPSEPRLGRAGPPEASRYPGLVPGEFGGFEKVLRLGEGRRRKRLAQQAQYIGTLEPEFEKLSRRRAPRQDRRVPAAARERRDARRDPLRGVRRRPRGVQAHDGRPPLRRPADGRHRPARGRHRRDEDR